MAFRSRKVTVFVTLRKRNAQGDGQSLRYPYQRRQVAVGVRQHQRFDDADLTEQGVADLRRYGREHVVALRNPERVGRGEPEAGEPSQSRPALVIV